MDPIMLAAGWHIRLQSLFRQDPALAGDLRRLLDGQLTPVPPTEERPRIGSPVMNADASGHGRVYQVGRDQHIVER